MAKAYICDGCGYVLTGEPVPQDVYMPIELGGKGRLRFLFQQLVDYTGMKPIPLKDLCPACWKRILRAVADGADSVDLTQREEEN